MSVVFACILLKEQLTARKMIAFGMSFLGVVTVAGGSLLHFDGQTLMGIVLCVSGAVCYGAFTALIKKWNCDPQLGLMLSFTVSSLLLNVLRGTQWSLNGIQLLGLVWNGVFCMAVAGVCWTRALVGGNTAKISNLAYITPFLSLVWVAVFLKEMPTIWALGGLCLIVMGIFVQLKDKRE